MLVLGRQLDESIAVVLRLGENTFLVLEIVVVDIRGDKVRLGIAAPEEVVVHRWENWEGAREDLERELASRGVQMAEIHDGNLPPEVLAHLAGTPRLTQRIVRRRTRGVRQA